MANQKQLEILKQGVGVWNQWRQENPEVKPRLSRARLVDRKLAGADLHEADLHLSDLTRADLRGANLEKAILSRSDLSSACFEDANLREAELIMVRLGYAGPIPGWLARLELCQSRGFQHCSGRL